MLTRHSTACAMGLAVALTLGASAPGLAQSDTSRAGRDTTRRTMSDSSRRMMTDSTHQGRTGAARREMQESTQAAMSDSSHRGTRRHARTHRRTSGGEAGTATSTRRIRVRKESSGGEAMTPTRADTTTAVIVHTDTATAAPPPPPQAEPAPAPTPAPAPAADTGFRPHPMMSPHGRRLFGTSGLYLGVGGGAALPISALKNIGYDNGWNVTVPLGWESNTMRFPLGLRVVGSYDRLNGSTSSVLTSNPSTGSTTVVSSDRNANVWSAVGDVTLKLPFNASRTASLYVLGGGGVHYFRNVANTAIGFRLQNASSVVITENRDNVTKWGAEAGAGLEFGGGPVSFFVESRWVNLFTPGQDLRYVPVIAGVTLR